jgi:hypothetical protein
MDTFQWIKTGKGNPNFDRDKIVINVWSLYKNGDINLVPIILRIVRRGIKRN